MKDHKKISINHPILRRIRNNTRKILILEIKKQLDLILKEHRPHKDWEYFDIISNESICLCYKCGQSDRDMIFHADTEALNGKGLWYCVECHEAFQERMAPEKFFNKGILARPEAHKPCYRLGWCPYGSLVEAFRPIGDPRYTFCYAFHHQCPAFYVAELVCEDSIEPPPPNPKLIQSLRDINWFNEKQVINPIEGSMKSPNKWYYRPCEHLLWCPYGSLGDPFQPQKKEKQYACQIYPHDCPVFYHAEPIEDDLEMWTQEEVRRTVRILDKELFIARNRKKDIDLRESLKNKKDSTLKKSGTIDFFKLN